MAAKTTNLYKDIKKCWREVLGGTLIAFDPSTGSHSSMPGYAIFKAGKLVESGIIKVSPNDRRNVKLYSIVESLRTEFPEPDVIAIENIPPVMFKGGRGMSGWSIAALQRAVGAIISSFNCEYVEVAPIAWKNYKFDGYIKGDAHDAICIGLCVLGIANQIETELAKGET